MRCSSTDARLRRRTRAGASLVELAILMPLFWLLMICGFQFGRGLYAYSRLVEAVARGARYASRVDFDEPDHTFRARVANVALCGSPEPCTSPAVPGLTTSHIDVSWTRDTAGVPRTITVSIRDFSYPVLFREFRWSGKPAVTTRFVGVYKT